MRRLFRPQLAALALAASFACLAPQSAEANDVVDADVGPVAGLAIVNTGEDIYPVGPLPDAIKDMPEVSGHMVGMKCSVFGVFWVMLHQWDCEAVVYMEGTTNYYDESAFNGAFKASDYEKGDADFGFMGSYAKWLLLLGLIIAGVVGMRGGSDDEESDAG